MRTPIIAGNWKMNAGPSEAIALVDALRDSLSASPPEGAAVEVVVCPPFISLVPVAERLRGSSIGVGAQNADHRDKGAFTGEISAAMLVGLVSHVILGHSERRQHFGETDQGVNLRLKAVLGHGLTPIVCVGETLEENEASRTEAVLERQVRGALADVEPTDRLIVAYEPIWAIGTGRAATADHAIAAIRRIRDVISVCWNPATADRVRIQYGGSVTGANIAEFVSAPDIDGALVGGASLKPADFDAIIRATARAKATSPG